MGNRAEVELGFEDKEIAEGLAKAEKRLERFGERAAKAVEGGHHGGHEEGMFGRFKELGEGLIAAESLHKFHELTEHFDTINKMAIRLNTSVESVQRLDALARMADLDVGTLAKGIEKVVRNLEEAETDPKIAQALKRLHLSADELKAADPEKQIEMIGAALEHARQHGEGQADVFNLIGKAAGEMTPLLLSAGEELEKLSKRKFLNKEDVQNLADFNDQLKDAVIRLQSLGGKAANWLANDLAGSAESVRRFFNDNPQAKSLKEISREVRRDMEQIAEQSRIDAEEMEYAAMQAREEKVWTDKIAAAREAARKGIEEDIKKQEEAAKISEEHVARLKEAISAQNEHNVESQNSPLENLVMKQQELSQLEKELAEAQKTENLVPEEKRLEIEKKIAQVKGQIIAAQKELTTEEEKAQEVAKKHAESAKEMKAEMEILQARAHGHDRAANAMEKELALKKEAHQIAQDLGISEEKALQIAKEKQALEDKINRRKNGYSATIHGYTGPTTTGPKSESGLDWLNRVRGKPLSSEWKFPALDRLKDLQNKVSDPNKPPAANRVQTVALANGEQVMQLLSRIAQSTEGLSAY